MWERVNFVQVCYGKHSNEMKELISTFITREQSLMKLFELRDKIGSDGLDLLYRLLDLNP